MTHRMWVLASAAAILLLGGRGYGQAPSAGKPSTPETAARTNSSYIDDRGTAHVTRLVPVPSTISPEAQAQLARAASDAPSAPSVAEQRAGTDRWQTGAGKEFQKLYPANVAPGMLGGVQVRVVTPIEMPPANAGRVLMNLHGGGFVVDSGSLTETIPMANLTRTRVVAVLYRQAPEHPFPAAVEDAVAVYRELLKTYPPSKIAVYGTSAGAILTAEFAVKVKALGLPEPAALGIFSGLADFSRLGDSESIYTLNGLSGFLNDPSPKLETDPYVGSTDTRNPVLSPVFADLHGLPPALLMTSTRDLLLSGTTILHRALLRAGVPAELIVFEGLPHAFWNSPALPETKEAEQAMADFFIKQLSR